MIKHSHIDNNRRTVQRAYQSLAVGDVRAFLERLAPDVDWHEARGLRLSGGRYRGREAVAEKVLGPFTAAITGLTVRADRLLCDGDVVAVLGRYGGVAAATNAEVDVAFVHVWDLNDGLAQRFSQHTDTALLNELLDPDATRQAPRNTQ